MAYNTDVRKFIRSAGRLNPSIFKEERAICAPQDSEMKLIPIGSAKKKVINMCANNYLGLSSHPKLLKLLRRT